MTSPSRHPSEDERLVARDEFVAKLEALGIDNLEELHQRRRLLYAAEREGGRDLAELKVMYGPFGAASDLKKRLAAALALRFLKPEAGDPATPEKSTEKMIEAWVENHPEYRAHIDKTIAERKLYLLAQLEEDEISQTIESRLREMSIVAAETRR
jgi:hypothetical protein